MIPKHPKGQDGYTRTTGKEAFSNGTPISSWFKATKKVSLAQLGKAYVITDFGAKLDSMLVQTETIQKVIDAAASKGGGVIVIPKLRHVFRRGDFWS